MAAMKTGTATVTPLRPAASDSGGISPAGDGGGAALVMVPLDALAPHPCNRTSLGDLTELTASIKAQGLFEPLNVLTAAAFTAAAETGGDPGRPGPRDHARDRGPPPRCRRPGRRAGRGAGDRPRRPGRRRGDRRDDRRERAPGEPRPAARGRGVRRAGPARLAAAAHRRDDRLQPGLVSFVRPDRTCLAEVTAAAFW